MKKMQYTLSELVSALPSELGVEIKGDPKRVIKGVCTIQDARPDCITFLTNPAYKKFLANTQAAAVILSPNDAAEVTTHALISKNPHFTYAKIAEYFDPKSAPEPGIHPTAVIEEHADIHPTASIGAHCTIAKNVKIGAHVVISPGCAIGELTVIDESTRLDANVTIYDRIKLGKRVKIASGTVIGSDGFGMANHRGTWHKVPQLGSVIIEDDVEIGSNCSIDRGAVGDTVIEKGVKLDNLIQIAHNVRIGANTAIAALVGISGSTVIGKNCLIAGAAGFAGHLTIADQVVVLGGAAITRSIHESGVYASGVGGVVKQDEWRKNSARVNRLEQLVERVKILEKKLESQHSTREK